MVVASVLDLDLQVGGDGEVLECELKRGNEVATDAGDQIFLVLDDELDRARNHHGAIDDSGVQAGSIKSERKVVQLVLREQVSQRLLQVHRLFLEPELVIMHKDPRLADQFIRNHGLADVHLEGVVVRLKAG